MPATLLVTFQQRAGELQVMVDGDLDVSNRAELVSLVLDQLATCDPERIVIDVGASSFFGADGVRALLDVGAAIAAPVRVACRTGAPARRVLDLFEGDLRHVGLLLD